MNQQVISLNNGVEMPQLGLGTWQLRNKKGYNAMMNALEIGYQHIDTASIYENEKPVGRAVRDSGLTRDEIFVTSKVWNDAHGHRKTLKACRASLKRLKLDYVDLYLIHWPQEDGKRQETWQAMEELLADGKTRAIGVSNYTPKQIEDVLKSGSVVPAVNQIKLHPYNYQQQLETVQFCQQHGIALTAYTPLTATRKLDDPRLLEIAAAYEKTAAQVMLRWGIQHGFIEIPKSASPERQAENLNIFDFMLSDEHMAQLDAFGL